MEDKEIIEQKDSVSDIIILGTNYVVKNEENFLILQTDRGIIHKFDKNQIKNIVFI